MSVTILGSIESEENEKALESIGGDICISDIQDSIEISVESARVYFKYQSLVIGYIDYNIDENSAELKFIANSNMSKQNQIAYGTEYRGLESLQDRGIHISGLGEFMLRKFIEHLRVEENDIEIITAEIDNLRVIELFTKLKTQKIVGSLFEDKEEVDDYPKTFLHAYI